MRTVLTNAIWREMDPRVAAAKQSPAGEKPELSERLFLEAVLDRLHTGMPWMVLPEVVGDWNAVFQRGKR